MSGVPRIVELRCEAVPAGAVTRLEIEGAPPLAVYNLDGEYCATDDTCTHGEASLSEGDLEGREIVCPFHLGSFDIRTGAACRAPCIRPIRTCAVTVEAGVLRIAMKGSAGADA